MKYGFLILLLFFTGCATKSPIADLNLPQNASFYVKNDENFVDENKLRELKMEYLQKHFSVWQDDFSAPSREDMFWGLNSKSGFGESKKPLESAYFSELEGIMMLDSYPSMQKKAIMIKTANVRLFPTNKPRFSSADGMPFDRWQNSLIFAFTPIVVLHEDLFKEWALVQSSFVAGWVKNADIAFLSDKQVAQITQNAQDLKFKIPLSDQIPLYFENQFIENARIGMIFEARDDSHIYIYRRNLDGSALRVLSEVDSRAFADFPLMPNEANIARIIDLLIPQNYGWGGLYENRDCSAFLRDVFANFAIWLPRNSKAQVNYAHENPHSTFLELPQNADEKLEFITQNAQAFRTLVWLKGHIMLYIGNLGDVPMVVHDAWSIKTSQGEQILGGISITTLTPGSEQNSIFVAPLSLLDRIRALNILIDGQKE